MFKKVVLSLFAVMLILAGTAFAQQEAPNVVNAMIPVQGTGEYVNPGGLGDALIYGYYNVRGMDNFFNIINTDEVSQVVARVRFREAKTSKEILDFNVCLSHGDVWTAVIGNDGTRGYVKAFEVHTPATKTNPIIPAAGVTFKDETNGGIAGVKAEDTKEGYFEVIGLIATADTLTCPDVTVGSPANDVLNSLMGNMYMVDLSNGETFGYSATPIANFAQAGITSSGLGTEIITLDSGTGGVNAVNFALTKSNLYGFYALEQTVLGESAFVVTFPTKRVTEGVTGQTLFDRETDTACPIGFNNVRISLPIWDDAEHLIASPQQFSPVVTPVTDLCYEANVIELSSNDSGARSNILDSNVEIDISTQDFEMGWVNIILEDMLNERGEVNHQTTSTSAAYTSFGVPAIGYQLHSFNGDNPVAGMLPMQYKTIVGAAGLVAAP